MISGFAFLEKEAKRILILGYGGGNIGNFLLTMFPKAHIDMIEHDPVVMNATLHFMYHHSPHQANFSLLTGDGRIWMEQNREKYCNIYATWARVTEELEDHKYDVVISDACASPCELVSLETFEFIHNCLLKREGVLIQNMFGWNLDLRLLRNMQLIFGEGLFVIDTPEKTPNTILVGKKMLDSKAFSLDQILNRAKWFSIRHKNLSFDILDVLKHAVHAARPIVNAELFTDLDSLNERKK
jgi:spermidine synthase